MYKNSFVHYLTKIAVDIMFYGGILCTLAVPFIMPWLAGYLDYSETVILPFTIILFLSGLCSVYILWQLKAIFRTLLGGNPFVGANINCLRKCSVASFLIAVIYLAKMTFWFTITTLIFVIVFSLLSLFCLTLKDVFKQAVAYKEENDGTV